MSPKSWCRALKTTRKGRLVFWNMARDLVNSRLRATLFFEIFTQIVKLWNSGELSAGELDDAWLALRRAQAELLDIAPQKYLCQGPPIPYAPTEPPQCSLVTDLATFVEHNLDWAQTGRSIQGIPNEEDGEFLQRFGLHGLVRGSIKTRRPFAWVTRTEEITQIRRNAKAGEVAYEVRNRLGLIHKTTGRVKTQQALYLVEIRYPPDIFAEGGLAVPTFIEGCPSEVYRSRRGEGDWGATVDLLSTEDGLPEAVHLALPLRDDFELHILGYPVKAEGEDWNPESFAWDKFENSFADVLKVSIERELRRYV